MDIAALVQTFLAAMLPIGEMRLAIPLGILVLKAPWYQVFLIAVLGNMAPVLALVFSLERVSKFLLSFSNPLGKLIQWRTDHLKRIHGQSFRRYGAAFLVLFVAVPLPITGAWTGSLVAWTFQVPPRVAIPLIGLGVFIGAVVVTGLTLAGVQVSHLLTSR